MHGLAVYVKEGLPFAQDLFLEKSADTTFYLTQMRFSRSSRLLMCLSLET